MFQSIQWRMSSVPLPVAASRSCAIRTKLATPSGTLLHVNGGETWSPACVYFAGIGPPSGHAGVVEPHDLHAAAPAAAAAGRRWAAGRGRRRRAALLSGDERRAEERETERQSHQSHLRVRDACYLNDAGCALRHAS